ncbi:unnamed protein product [Cunninghamella blakesleeana]
MTGIKDFVEKVTHPHFHHHEDHGKEAADKLQGKDHHHENPENKNISAKYLNDPMRTSPKPDTVGQYKDPMGRSDTGSYDATNTGA